MLRVDYMKQTLFDKKTSYLQKHLSSKFVWSYQTKQVLQVDWQMTINWSKIKVKTVTAIVRLKAISISTISTTLMTGQKKRNSSNLAKQG